MSSVFVGVPSPSEESPMDSRVGWVSEKGRVADTVGDPVLRTPLEDGVPELI